MPAYLILTETFNFATRTAGAIASTMYRFTNTSLSQLKRNCSYSLPESQWISTQDAVCALIFRQKVEARLAADIIKEDEVVQYSFPVEYRSVIEPPLPSDFVGNAVIFTATPFLLVSDLIASSCLSLAASSVRKNIQEVDNAYIDNAIAVIKSLPDPCTLNFYGAINSKRTGINSTTYKSFVMPDEGNERIGRYEVMRLIDGAFGDGMFVVMPVRADGMWEVVITLAEEAMEHFEDEEWRRYAVKC